MRDESLPQELAALAEQRWHSYCECWPQATSWPPEQQQQGATALALSDFINDNCQQQPQWLQQALLGGALDAAAFADDIERQLAASQDEAEASALLRRFRRQHSVTIAIHDLLGLWAVEAGLEAISALADALIMSALRWLL